MALSVPTLIYATQARDLAQQINHRAYQLNTSGTGSTTYGTSNPGQVPALAESYLHYQQAISRSFTFLLWGGILILTGLILAISVRVQVRRKRVSDPHNRRAIAVWLSILALTAQSVLTIAVLVAWVFAFFLWGLAF